MRLAAPGKWAPPEETRQILAWFAVSLGLLVWAVYLLTKTLSG